MKMCSGLRLTVMQIITHFHMKGFERRLVLKQRHKLSRKWSVKCRWRETRKTSVNELQWTLWTTRSHGTKSHMLVGKLDFQNRGRCIVLEFPLCNLFTSMCDFVPCDRVVQRTYWFWFYFVLMFYFVFV